MAQVVLRGANVCFMILKEHTMQRQRGHSTSREKRRDPDRDAIVTKKEYEKGLRGVGYAHKFVRNAELLVDRLMLEGLQAEPGQRAPYRVDSPRHITSVPFIELDPQALQMLRIGRNVERETFEETMRATGYDASVRMSEHHARIIDIHPIGGRVLIAEVDCVPISLSRKSLKRIFAEAGVGIPEMHAPHFKVGTADTLQEQTRMRNVARNVLIDTMISVEPIDAYFATYTESVRPEFVPDHP